MEPVLAGTGFGDSLQRDVDVLSAWIAEDGPVVFGWLSRNVPERFLPEGEHALKVVAVDHDRSDVHGEPPHELRTFH